MPAVDERRFGKHGSDMPRTVIGVMSAVFGTAEQFQARRDLPTWAVHLSDAMVAGSVALWYRQ